MGTYTISNKLVSPSGTPLVGVSVSIAIKPESAYRISDGAELVSPLILVTDSTGTWSTPLEDNLNITPAGSYYEIVESVPPMYGGTQVWQVYVNGAGGTLGSLWTTQNPPPSIPIDPAATYLTQAAGDTRYQAKIVDTAVVPGAGTGNVGDVYVVSTGNPIP